MEGSLSLLVLVGYKHTRVRKNCYFGFLMLVFVALYLGWLLIGFPQYDGTFVLPRFIQVGDPFALGYMLNRFSKLFLCLSWVSLYSKPAEQNPNRVRFRQVGGPNRPAGDIEKNGGPGEI